MVAFHTHRVIVNLSVNCEVCGLSYYYIFVAHVSLSRALSSAVKKRIELEIVGDKKKTHFKLCTPYN